MTMMMVMMNDDGEVDDYGDDGMLMMRKVANTAYQHQRCDQDEHDHQHCQSNQHQHHHRSHPLRRQQM